MNITHILRQAMIPCIACGFLAGGCAKPTTETPTSQTETPAVTATTTPTTTPAVTPTTTPVAPKPTTTTKPATAPKPKPTTTTQPAPTVSTVTITNGAFSPQIIAVKAGDTVVWVNKDTVNHTTASAGTLLWDSGTILPGGSYKRVFPAAGSYNYTCKIHPSMKGTVIVR